MIDLLGGFIGSAGTETPKVLSPRQLAIKDISAVLKKTDATDQEREDALDALVELSKGD